MIKMKNDIQLFKFEKSNVRTLMINNEPYFVGKDVANILGYADLNRAINQHVDNEDRKVLSYKASGDLVPSLWRDKNDFSNKVLITESGVYSLIFGSQQPNAKKFKHWVTSEVLPQIRKTGSYHSKNKRLEIMKANSDTKRAELLYRIAMATDSNSSKQILLAKAAETITGQMTIPMMKQKEYSASDIANKLNITANKVGRIANRLGLKAKQPGQNEYGRWSNSKSKYSDKEVPQWLYSEKGFQKIKQVIHNAAND